MIPKQKQSIEVFDTYTTSRDVYQGVFLDLNEHYEQWVKLDFKNICNLNRYPDSFSNKLRIKLVETYLPAFKKENIIVGMGTMELIELVIRAFVEPKESVMIMDPCYAAYTAQAQIADANIKRVSLNEDFSLNLDEIKANLNNVKVMFICNPNNPTGSLVTERELIEILNYFKGVIVIDEAYIEFAGLDKSLIKYVSRFDNVFLIRSFSKAWGLAGVRLGYGVASEALINILMKVKNPYNVPAVIQNVGIQALEQIEKLDYVLRNIKKLKEDLISELKKHEIEAYNTESNFILVRLKDASSIYQRLGEAGVIVRDRSFVARMQNMLRITVGNTEENKLFISKLLEVLPRK